MRKQSLFAEAAQQRLDTTIHASRATVAQLDGVVDAYDRLRECVRSRTSILARRAYVERGPDVNRALLAMAASHVDWIRPVETWTPAEGSAWPVMAALAAHLFARYAMPRFLTSVWLEGDACEILPEQGWYKQLAQGESLRRIGIPMRITRAMAHRFFKARDDFSFVGALRWAQVHAFGGEEKLARAVLATRLGGTIENEEFWETVIQFFVHHADLELRHVGPIVDFLQHQKFEWREGVGADGVFGPLPPPHPEMTMKGRTPAALLRLVDAWHRELGKRPVKEFSWPRAPVQEFRWIEKVSASDGEGMESRVWSISELCSSGALLVEGRAMRHCVATYAMPCLHRRTSIWSMQLETRRGRHRILTVEVDPTARVIRQARRKFNGSPNAPERAILAMWAERERLIIPDDLRA